MFLSIYWVVMGSSPWRFNARVGKSTDVDDV